MFSRFGAPVKKPSEYTPNNKQHPYAIRVSGNEIVKAQLPDSLHGYGSEKSFRKYFGKKVTKMLYLDKSISLSTDYRCKAVKKVSIYGIFPRYHNFRYIKEANLGDISPLHFTPMYKLHELTLSYFLPKISEYKYLKSLFIEAKFEDLNFKQLRKLANLESLSLVITEQQFSENYEAFLAIEGLKRLEYKLPKYKVLIDDNRGDRDLSGSTAMSDFLEKTSRLKNLQFLGMDLSSFFYKIGQSSRVKFLEHLNQTKIPSFDIELSDTTVPSFNPLNSQVLRASLKNIDLLKVEIGTDASVSIAYGNDDNVVNQPMKNARKKLSFKILQEFKKKTMLSGFGGFGGFGQGAKSTSIPKAEVFEPSSLDPVTNLQTLFKDCLDITFPFSESPRPKHLKTIALDFSQISVAKRAMAEKLYVRIMENTTNLENLKITRSNLMMKTTYDSYGYFKLVAHTSAVKNLSSLDLQDGHTQTDFLTILSDVLELKNLKKAWLSFRDENTNNIHKTESKITLQIPQDSKITDLYVFPPTLDEKRNQELIKMIITLPELEAITVPSCEQLTANPNNCLALLNGIKNLKKLKLLLFNNFVYNTTQSSTKNAEEEQVVLRMKNAMKEVFESNSYMQELYFDTPLEKIRYARY